MNAASSPSASATHRIPTSAGSASSGSSAPSSIASSSGSGYSRSAQYTKSDATPRSSRSRPCWASVRRHARLSTSRGGLLAMPWMNVTWGMARRRGAAELPTSLRRVLDEPELLADLEADLALEAGARHRQVVLAAADRDAAGGVDAGRAPAVHHLRTRLGVHAAQVQLAADGAADHAELAGDLGEGGCAGV